MGLRTDVGTVLIVRELRGSSTAIGIRTIVYAAELATSAFVASGALLLDLVGLA